MTELWTGIEFIEVTEGLTQMSGINDNHFKDNLDIISNNKISKTKSYNLKTVTFDQIIPKNSKKSDWEVELAFIIGKTTKNVTIDDAMSFVAGYTICNDVSEREWQLEHGSQWSKGKSFDTFAPIGPWLVTKDEINDPHNLAMWLNVNGDSMQSGNTKTMIFNIPEIISYLSSFVTLHPGDVVTTGTPPGVGMGMKPEAIFLKPGDEMHLGIDGLGEQKQKVK